MTSPSSAPAESSSSVGATPRRTCYSCGGYSFNGKRHRTCKPKYRRARLSPCSICGAPALGVAHRKCRYPVSDKRPCAYCGELTKGTFHNGCIPVGLGRLAMFADLPGVVQRQCVSCDEWYPFAAVDGDKAGTPDAWSPHGVAATSGRPLFNARCRACMAARRAERDREYNLRRASQPPVRIAA